MSQPSDYTEILERLTEKKAWIEAQIAELEAELSEITIAVSAVEKLHGAPTFEQVSRQVENAVAPLLDHYEGMSMRAAALSYLQAKKRGATTATLWSALSAGGITSSSVSPTNTLYNILNKSPQFRRHKNLWKLKEHDPLR